MPASKRATSVCSFSSHTDSGTPICELYERGERTIFCDGSSNWYSHSLTIVLPLEPVMPTTGMSNSSR